MALLFSGYYFPHSNQTARSLNARHTAPPVDVYTAVLQTTGTLRLTKVLWPLDFKQTCTTEKRVICVSSPHTHASLFLVPYTWCNIHTYAVLQRVAANPEHTPSA